MVLLLIIWTWGLTPLWVNITISCIEGLSFIGRFIINVVKAYQERDDKIAESFQKAYAKIKAEEDTNNN